MQNGTAKKIEIGARTGKLTVVADTGNRKNGYTIWRCRCDCGNLTVVGQTLLQSGKTRSCGCVQKMMYRENLKLVGGTSVTLLEAHKKKLLKNNSSGCTGVYRDGRSGKWIAQISFCGKTRYLGSYAEFVDAVEARKQAEEETFEPFLEQYYEERDKEERQKESKIG